LTHTNSIKPIRVLSRRSLLAGLGAAAAMPWPAKAAPGSGGEIVFATWGGAEIKNLTRAQQETALDLLCGQGYRIARSGTEDMLAVLPEARS